MISPSHLHLRSVAARRERDRFGTGVSCKYLRHISDVDGPMAYSFTEFYIYVVEPPILKKYIVKLDDFPKDRGKK